MRAWKRAPLVASRWREGHCETDADSHAMRFLCYPLIQARAGASAAFRGPAEKFGGSPRILLQRSLPRVKILVLAKAPEPGRVKTRLATGIGNEAAARLHARLVERTLSVASSAAVGDVVLCCAPDTTHPFFARMATKFGVVLVNQGGGDVGVRMASALARFPPAILVGCDCPVFAPAHFASAARALGEGADIVLTPAEDGGYVLVGVREPQPHLFADMEWGDAAVLARTRARIDALSLRSVELETLWDVDRPADLARLRALAPGWLERE